MTWTISAAPQRRSTSNLDSSIHSTHAAHKAHTRLPAKNPDERHKAHPPRPHLLGFPRCMNISASRQISASQKTPPHNRSGTYLTSVHMLPIQVTYPQQAASIDAPFCIYLHKRLGTHSPQVRIQICTVPIFGSKPAPSPPQHGTQSTDACSISLRNGKQLSAPLYGVNINLKVQ